MVDDVWRNVHVRARGRRVRQRVRARGRRSVAPRVCVRAGVGRGERVRARSRQMRALRDRAVIVLGACGMEEPRRVSLRKKTVARGGDVRRGYHEEEDGGRVRARGHRVRLDVRAPDRGAAIVRRSST